MLRLLTCDSRKCQVRGVSGGHFVLNSTLIVFVVYSFSHVPLPYNTFHVTHSNRIRTQTVTPVLESTVNDYGNYCLQPKVQTIFGSRID